MRQGSSKESTEVEGGDWKAGSDPRNKVSRGLVDAIEEEKGTNFERSRSSRGCKSFGRIPSE